MDYRAPINVGLGKPGPGAVHKANARANATTLTQDILDPGALRRKRAFHPTALIVVPEAGIEL